jgi:ABC-type microcin C transport system permease subunit YejE
MQQRDNSDFMTAQERTDGGMAHAKASLARDAAVTSAPETVATAADQYNSNAVKMDKSVPAPNPPSLDGVLADDDDDVDVLTE